MAAKLATEVIGAAAAFGIAALLALGAAPAPAPAQTAPRRTSTRAVIVATSEGALASFGDPAAARSGWVVFHAVQDDGREGIWATSGGAPVAIVETGSLLAPGGASAPGAPRVPSAPGPAAAGGGVRHFQTFGREPTVNDAFTCAFTTLFAEGGSAVVACEGIGGKFQLVADSTEAFRDFGALAAVNAGKQIAFRATVDPKGHPDTGGYDPRKATDPTLKDHPERVPPPSRFTFDGRRDEFHVGLFLERGTDLIVLGSTTKGLLDLQDGFALNDAGAVVFRASCRPKSWSLLLATGGSPVVLAEGNARFASFGPPSIDARGRVAYVAEGTRGDTAICRAAQASGLPEILADAQTGFTAFGPNVAIDDRGRVAFVGRRADGHEGLYVAASASDVTELLAVGELVGRRAVKHLRLGSRSCVRSDRIALVAQLEPDVEAVILLYVGK